MDYQDDRKHDAGDKGDRGARRPGRGKPRKKVCPFILDKSLVLDFKNMKVLYRFINETGRIVPRRVSGVTARNQRKLTKHIKRARNLGLMAPKIEMA